MKVLSSTILGCKGKHIDDTASLLDAYVGLYEHYNEFKAEFLAGYERMLEVLLPQTIICYGKPFDEMRESNIICFPYTAFRKGESA